LDENYCQKFAFNVVTSQLNTTQVGVDKVMGWPTPLHHTTPPQHHNTTPPQKLLRHFQETQEADFGMQPYFDPYQLNMEDGLNILISHGP
jgi:hypothetical protein